MRCYILLHKISLVFISEPLIQEIYNSEFDEINITDQNDRPLEIEDNVNLTLLISK